jgi:predicted porin
MKALTWHGITLYDLVDMGVTHGAPLSNTAGLRLNYLISKNSNGSYSGVGPNALSSSFVGLKGSPEIADGLSAIFNLQTGFNPQSGKLSDGLGSIVQNNGLPIGMQNSFADSEGWPGLQRSGLCRSQLADIWNALAVGKMR